MSETIDKSELPTTFGAFKPVGHVMLGLPTAQALQATRADLLKAGWSASGLVDFAPRESVEAMQDMIDNASGLASFGHELTLMRRYLGLSQAGYRWLLVKAEDSEQAQRASTVAKLHGAGLAVHYKTFTVEDMI